MIGRFSTPITWPAGSLDKKPITDVVFILFPPAADPVYIRAMTAASRVFGKLYDGKVGTEKDFTTILKMRFERLGEVRFL